MVSPPLLWLDYRHAPDSPGLFDLLQMRWPARRLVHPLDIGAHIQANQPQFLCFEFDIPTAAQFAVLHSTHLQHPGLPILMMAESPPPMGAQAAFRMGIWDYLVSPVSASNLNASIDAFAQFCRQRHHSGLSQDPPSETVASHKTGAARKHLEAHFAEEVRLPWLADLCHLSTSEFSRSFKKENGLPFSAFLLQLRIRRACELLSEPTTPIKHVAFEVGFNDVSYFARAFHRLTGLTPSAFQHSDVPGSTLTDDAWQSVLAHRSSGTRVEVRR